jgi:imidazolonepropionase
MAELLLVRNASSVLTVASPSGPKRHGALGELGAVKGGAVLVREGVIAAVGSLDSIIRHLSSAERPAELDAGGGIVMPGFVDPHTHLVFAGTRAEEFEARLVHGRDYLDFVKSGGGGLSTVRATRAASTDQLVSLVRARLDRMLTSGTTTAEVKTGYGLSVSEELRHLEVIAEAARDHPVDVSPTVLPAHFRSPEHPDDNGPWLAEIEDRLLPEVEARALATAVDAFCERGTYAVEESRRVLAAGRAHGLRAHLHADQLSDSGGAQLAVEAGALSADHLGHVSEAGITALAGSATVAVLIPGSCFFVPTEKVPPVRRMVDAGVAIALASDCNPGTSPISSMPLTIALATILFGLSVAEGIAASTINAARALGLGDRVGSLEAGKQADLIVLHTDDPRDLAYRFGHDLVRTVVKAGRVVVDRQRTGPL